VRYNVAWTPTAEQQLAALWLTSVDRAAVTSATATIDQVLSVDPEQHGTPNFDTVRTLVVEPIGVDFEVVDADRIVYVLTVWQV
jgi:hypothetical protein